VCEDPFDENPAHPTLEQAASVVVFDEVATVLEQDAVLHAGRTRHLARTATKAEVNVLDNGLAEGQSSFLHGLEKIDAAAR
jgi:hypothetical protein